MTEIKIEIPLSEGYGQFITKNIDGELECVIINMPGKGQLKIESETGYILYESKDIEGIQYIPIRVQSRDHKGERISFSSHKYCLNEKLIITVRGFKINQSVKLRLRWN